MFSHNYRTLSQEPLQGSGSQKVDWISDPHEIGDPEPPKFASLTKSNIPGARSKATATYYLSMRHSPYLCHAPYMVVKITIERNRFRNARQRILRAVERYFGKHELLPNRYALCDYNRALKWYEVDDLRQIREIAGVKA